MRMKRWLWIGLGLLFLAWGLSELRFPLLRFGRVFDLLFNLWPLILVVLGLNIMLQSRRNRGDAVIGGLLAALGAALLANNFGYSLSVWGAILVGAGVGFLFRAVVE